MKKDKHTIAMKIVKILIESSLSITDQLKVIESVRERLNFCRNTANEMKQTKLDL